MVGEVGLRLHCWHIYQTIMLNHIGSVFEVDWINFLLCV